MEGTTIGNLPPKKPRGLGTRGGTDVSNQTPRLVIVLVRQFCKIGWTHPGVTEGNPNSTLTNPDRRSSLGPLADDRRKTPGVMPPTIGPREAVVLRETGILGTPS